VHPTSICRLTGVAADERLIVVGFLGYRDLASHEFHRACCVDRSQLNLGVRRLAIDNKGSMLRMMLVYGLTIGLGYVGAIATAWLVGLLFPTLRALTFVVLLLWWFVVGYLYALRQEKALGVPRSFEFRYAAGWPSTVRDLVAVVLAAASSFALGTVLDLVSLSIFAELPFATSIMALGNWSAIAIVCGILAFGVAKRLTFLIWPFAINAALAGFAGTAAAYNLMTAAGLVVATLIVRRAVINSAPTQLRSA